MLKKTGGAFMQLKYIFLLKKDAQKNSFPSNVFFSEIFKNVTKNSFEIDVTKYKSACISYSEFFDKENGNYYLTISFSGDKKEYTAQALSKTHSTLTKGSHRSNYFIVTVLDEVSEYYANRAYPLFGHFERKVRELSLSCCYQDFWCRMDF